LGYILFVPILLHGTFDFVILALDFLGKLGYLNNNISVMLCGILLLAAYYYYMKESKAQSDRLEHMDAAKLYNGQRQGNIVV